MAVFDEVFAWSGKVSADVEMLPEPVRGELLFAVLLAPFAETDLRAPVAPRITATDASPYGAGVVCVSIPAEAATELWRITERRGLYVRLDEVLEDDTVARPTAADRAWGSELVRGIGFETKLAYTFRRRGSHINICEHRARRSSLRQLRRDPANHGKREVVGLDSRVTLGSAAKGRSSAKAINHELRKSMPYLVGPEIQEGDFWVGSTANPADGSSRDWGPPDQETPIPWVARFLGGDLAALQERVTSVVGEDDQSPDPAETSGEAKNPVPRPEPPPRQGVVLREHAEGVHATRQRRRPLVDQFEVWLGARSSAGLASLAERPRELDAVLAEYGQHMFDQQQSQWAFVETINGISTKFWWLKQV